MHANLEYEGNCGTQEKVFIFYVQIFFFAFPQILYHHKNHMHYYF